MAYNFNLAGFIPQFDNPANKQSPWGGSAGTFTPQPENFSFKDGYTIQRGWRPELDPLGGFGHSAFAGMNGMSSGPMGEQAQTVQNDPNAYLVYQDTDLATARDKGAARLNGQGYDVYDMQGNHRFSDQFRDLSSVSATGQFLSSLAMAMPAAAGFMMAPAAAGAGGAAGGGWMAGVEGAALAGPEVAGMSGAGLAGGAGAAGAGSWMTGAEAAGAMGAGGAAGGTAAPIFSTGGAATGFGGAAGGLGGLGGSGGLGSLIKSGVGALGGGSNWLGAGATLLGGLAGAQGEKGSESSSFKLDPRMDAAVYGSGGLVPATQGTLGSQLPLANQTSSQLMQVGSGLLNKSDPTTSQNPYLKSMLDDLQRRNQEVIDANLLRIKGNAIAAGSLGGSRQGVAQGQAIAQGADNFTGQAANLLGSLYNQDMDRVLRQQTLGAGLLAQGQSAPWVPLNNASGILGNFKTGTQTNSSSQGGGFQGALGGLLGGAQWAQNAGLFGSSSNSDNKGWW